MSALSDQAATIVSEMRDAYARLKADTSPGIFSTDAQDQVAGDVAALGPQIDSWDGARSWAENGQRDDGSPYSWDKWIGWGKDLSSAINAYGAYFSDGGSWAVISGTVQASASQIGSAASSAAQGIGNVLLSGWTWAAVAAVGVLLVLGPGMLRSSR